VSPTAGEVDVVVVGAGIAGLSAAAALSTTHRVVVVEQESTVAHHASGRSASVLNETSGHPLVCALAHLGRPFFERPPDGFAEHPLLAPRGLLWIGSAGDEPVLDELARTAAPVAPTARRLTAAEINEMLPTFRDEAIAAGGLFEPDAMSIDTAALLQGYVRTLRAAGGSVVTSHEAIRLRRDDRGWQVSAGDASWRAAHVVDAAGAWGDVIAARAGVLPLGLTPMRRTAAIARTNEPVASWPMVMDITGRYYCEPEAGGLLISPADESTSDPCDAQPDELDVAIALDRVAEASGLALRSVVRAWAGLRTFAPDRGPVLGEDPDAPGFWWLVGQGGAGIKTAPAMSDLLARLVRGEGVTEQERELGVTAEALSPVRLRPATAPR
jgi:D-arginine dehydrogenase